MINYDLTKINALVFDVDGVLSAETVPVSADGVPVRSANIKDGYALQLAVRMGLHVAIITGAKVESVKHRYNSLGIDDVYLNCSQKLSVFTEYLAKYSLDKSEVLYMGDDIPDYLVMKACGCPCCPLDAANEIRDISVYVSHHRGGYGCVRDVVEQVLKAQGKWMLNEKAFEW